MNTEILILKDHKRIEVLGVYRHMQDTLSGQEDGRFIIDDYGKFYPPN